VLRIGAYEILHSDTPAVIAIDEAVELARRFAGDRSPGFVNGILDSVARGGGEDSG
jgi:N utilization substance protein B